MKDKILECLKEHHPGYGYYSNNILRGGLPGGGKSLLNCSDEIVPGSNERNRKIRELMHKRIRIPSDNFTNEWEGIINEIKDLMVEEHMAISGCSKREANQFLENHVDFTHVKRYITYDGQEYLSVDPKIRL